MNSILSLARFYSIVYQSSGYLLVLILCVACDFSPYQQPVSGEVRAIRAEQADKTKRDIVVGVAWSDNYDNGLLKGLTLAQEEINNAGGVLGRKIKLLYLDEQANPNLNSKARNKDQRIAVNIARQFAMNPDVIAVIGHGSSSLAIPAAITYEQRKILYFAPASHGMMLTSMGLNFTFRLALNNERIGEQLAWLCGSKNYKRMATLSKRAINHRETHDAFVKYATKLGINVVHTDSYSSESQQVTTDTDFRQTVVELRGKTFDAIFLADSADSGAIMIKQLREMGVDKPIIGGLHLDSDKLWKIAGNSAQDVIVPTLFNETGLLTQPFIKKFKERYYGQKPDSWAAQGYDMLWLLAYAIQTANSTIPIALATTLHYMPLPPLRPWAGVATGSVYLFNKQGDNLGKTLHFKILNDSRFEELPGANLSYIIHVIKSLREGRSHIHATNH